MASSSLSSRIGSLPAKFGLPLPLSLALEAKGEEYNSAPPRRGPPQASVASDIAANIPEPTISAHRFMDQSPDCRARHFAFAAVPPSSISYAQSPRFSTPNEP